MIVNEDFKFRDDLVKNEKDTVPIQLLTGPYKDVIYRYTRVGVKEKGDEDAVMQFEYDLHEMGNFTETSLRKDKKFEQYIGLVLNTLILEAVGGPKPQDEHRKDSTQESA